MIDVASVLIIAILLLILLLLLGGKSIAGRPTRSSISDDDWLPGDADGAVACAPEFVQKIFSPADQDFVLATNSPELLSLFRRERKKVALLWIRQTSAGIQRIMRQHARVARGNYDLDFGTEMKVIFHYGQIMLICGILAVLIRFAGPMWLRSLALYADELMQQITEVQENIHAATVHGKIHTVGAP